MAKLTKWNIQKYLKTPVDVMYFLEASLAEKDDEYLKIAVNDSIKALRRIIKKASNGTQEKRASV